MRKLALTTFLSTLLASCVVPTSFAEITEMKQYRGHWIACSVSGLHGFSSPCGADQGYEYVFVGSILSSEEITEEERHLQLKPEEVFFGAPPDIVSAQIIQGGCLPEAVAGDRWLFYLKKDEKSGALILWWGSPGGPVEESQTAIARLQRLTKMPKAGMIIGSVEFLKREGKFAENVPLHDHKLIATRISDGSKYSATTNSEGEFEFASLPTGKYDLSANSKEGLWAEAGEIDVKPKGCERVNFEPKTDGKVAGHIATAAGSPAQQIEVELLSGPSEDDYSQSLWTDKAGNYQFRGVQPGRYFVRVPILDEKFDRQSNFYYPGVSDSARAEPIHLGENGSRQNLNFTLPKPLAPGSKP